MSATTLPKLSVWCACLVVVSESESSPPRGSAVRQSVQVTARFLEQYGGFASISVGSLDH